MLKNIGIPLIALIVFYAIWAIYAKVAYREVKQDAMGRITLRPGLVLILMGLFAAILACLFGYMTIDAIINPTEGRIFFLLLGPPLTALMVFAAVIILWTRIRVSEEGLEYRSLRGWKVFSWSKVINVEHHDVLGTRVNIKNYRKLYFWPYGYGTNEVAAVFIKNDKPFSIS